MYKAIKTASIAMYYALLIVCVLTLFVKAIDGVFLCPGNGMYENTNNPYAFWHCANGIAYLKYCPSNLIWSQTNQHCTWNVIGTVVPNTSLPSTTTTVSSITTSTANNLPVQCQNYTSITDETRRPSNIHLEAQTDNTYFNSKPTWVRFEGSAGTHLANYSVTSGRCGSEGSGWIKHSDEPDIGETRDQRVCFNWKEFSCIWPVKIPMTNCGDFVVYGLISTPLSNARYCTI